SWGAPEIFNRSVYLKSYHKTFSWREVPMYLKVNRILQTMAGTAMAMAFMANAQAPAPATDSAPAAAPAAQAPAAQAPAAAPAAPTWSAGPMDISGFID